MSGPDPDGAERVRFLPGQVLTPEDLEAEQRYHRRRLRDHNRFVHGWGVVSGLDVRPGDAGSPPWAVEVSPGFALTPAGRTRPRPGSRHGRPGDARTGGERDGPPRGPLRAL